jgi:hypothetical protein
MPKEPSTCELNHLVKRAGLFKQVTRARNDHDFARASHCMMSRCVQLDNGAVELTNDQQCRRLDPSEGLRTSEVGPAATRNDGPDTVVVGGGQNCGAGPVLAPK